MNDFEYTFALERSFMRSHSIYVWIQHKIMLLNGLFLAVSLSSGICLFFKKRRERFVSKKAPSLEKLFYKINILYEIHFNQVDVVVNLAHSSIRIIFQVEVIQYEKLHKIITFKFLSSIFEFIVESNYTSVTQIQALHLPLGNQDQFTYST